MRATDNAEANKSPWNVFLGKFLSFNICALFLLGMFVLLTKVTNGDWGASITWIFAFSVVYAGFFAYVAWIRKNYRKRVTTDIRR
jgi:Na+-driven multidrug efflux pump